MLGEGTKRVPRRRPVQIRCPGLREQVLVEQPLAAIAREEPRVLQFRFERLGPHLEIPAARLDDLASTTVDGGGQQERWAKTAVRSRSK
ncbi:MULTISPECIES: hypothetical protein [unclassified Streptomyces]|uniref:hypothetical protein n=1 Tax=unclassified Streptomyces TaxID=2593676 RepID=UPI0013A6B5E4|nr:MULTISPECIES: hypothetical protein [unclassified Streptomyces]QZZ25806.1 hypothetical protein A7X85_05670 [Streptomyces sp. ST1015]